MILINRDGRKIWDDLSDEPRTVVEKAMARAFDLSQVSLPAANLRGLTGTKGLFVGADLRAADLAGCRLEECDFTDAYLAGANLSGGVFIRCRFMRTNLRGVDARVARFRQSTLADAITVGIDLTYAITE